MTKASILVTNLFGERHKYLKAIGVLLLSITMLLSMFFGYLSMLSTIALGFQLLLAVYSIFLNFLEKNFYIYRKIVFFVPFIVCILITFLINGYDSHYQTIATCFIIFPSTFCVLTYFKDYRKIFRLLFFLLLIFAFYFLAVNLAKFIEILKTKNFSDMRIGSKIAPINMLTIYFELGCALSLFYFLHSLKKKNIVLSIIYAFSFLLFLILGISIGSKQLIVVVLLSIIFVIVSFFGEGRWYLSLLIIGVLIFSFSIILFIPGLSSTVGARFLDMFGMVDGTNTRDFSTAERFEMIKEALYMFSKRPLFGYGIWGFAKYGSFGTYSHNTYSNALCETGFFGFSSFLIFALMPLFLIKQPKEKKVFAICIISCLLLQFLFGVLYYHKMMYFSLGFCYALIEQGKKENQKLVK